jgi:hypothetical protein
MASMHFNNHRRPKQSFLSSIGNKVKQAAEVAGAVKGLYDVGRTDLSGCPNNWTCSSLGGNSAVVNFLY